MLLHPLLNPAHTLLSTDACTSHLKFLLQHIPHRTLTSLQPLLELLITRHFGEELHGLTLGRAHRRHLEHVDLSTSAGDGEREDFELLDTLEALLDVLVDLVHVLGVSQQLEEVVIAEEIEAGEVLSLSLEELV